MCQIWSRSVQWFATGPSVTAKVSSVVSRCWRWLAQTHAKKQHLYIENYNSGPNMLTSTSLTFFTAIFLAFRSSLAEILMVMCRHVTTELYWNGQLVWTPALGLYLWGREDVHVTSNVELPSYVPLFDVTQSNVELRNYVPLFGVTHSNVDLRNYVISRQIVI